jgi:hypothetical protein
MSMDNWDNYFEVYEVISFDDGVRYRYFDGRIGKVPLRSSGHLLGTVQCERARHKTPSFEEQLKRMGKTVPPEQLEEWKRVARLYIPRKTNNSKEHMQRVGEIGGTVAPSISIAHKAVGTNLIFGMSRKLQLELGREYDAKFEKWPSSQAPTPDLEGGINDSSPVKKRGILSATSTASAW